MTMPLNVYATAAVLPSRMTLAEAVTREESLWLAGMENFSSAVAYYKDIMEPARLLPKDGVSLPVLVEGSAADQAVEVARALRRSGAWKAPRQLLFAHTTLDEDIASSTACMLQHALDVPLTLPFSISQQEEAAGFGALWTACAYLHGAEADERIVLVCADKWIPPQPRWRPPHPPLADGAAGLLIGGSSAKDREPAWVIIDVAIDVLWDGTASGYAAPHVERTCAALQAFMRRSSTGIDAMAAPPLANGLASRVAETLGAPLLPPPAAIDGVHLGTAHAFFDMHLRPRPALSGMTILYWSVTPSGHLGAILATVGTGASGSPEGEG